jgi:predicted ATPase
VNTEEQFQRVERALASAGLSVGETAPLIAELLQLPASERYPASTLTSEQKRRRLLAALSGWVLGASRVQPLVMVVEDLHWLDPSTLELLQLLADQGATAPLMLLYTARPEFRAPWPMHTHHSQITLNRLSSSSVREMVAKVAARNALARESVEVVVERTSGVPLFVEELTRAALESGNVGITGRKIPATLHDSLMARLDRLGLGKEVIQIGAVIGSEFSYELLHAVHPIRDEDLQGAIRTATDAELIYARGFPPDATYQFKHALIRDAAYEALLRSRRKEIHSRIAEMLVDQFPERATSAPSCWHITTRKQGSSTKLFAAGIRQVGMLLNDPPIPKRACT